MRDWLWEKITIEQAEKANMVHDRRLGDEGVPFGFLNHQWKALIAKMADGDELIEFSSPREAWKALCGRAGIAIARNGEIIASMITDMN